MRQIRVGNITIDAMIEREGPWRRPQDFFPAYDEATFKRHLRAMEPEVFDATLGMLVITYQTFLVSPPPTDEAVANFSGRSRQGAPERKTQKMPSRTRRSLTRGTPRGLFGSMGLIADHSFSVNS
jgi:hypothetical protein